MTERKVVYVNAKARLKTEPLYRHLAELMVEDPKACNEEINDVINHVSLMNDREVCFYLLGYLSGASAYALIGTRKDLHSELKTRLETFFNNGEFNYRRICK